MAEIEDIYKSKLGLKPVIATDDPDGFEADWGGDFVETDWKNKQILEKAILENEDSITDQGKTLVELGKTITDQGKTISEQGKSIIQLEKDIAKKADGLYVDQDNRLWLKSGDKVIGTGIELPKNGGGVPNVSDITKKYDYASQQEARNALPEEERKRGQVIAYQIHTGEWFLDMFIGDSIGSWNNSGSWRSFLTSYDIIQTLEDIETIKSDLIKISDKTKNIPDGFDLDEDNNLYHTSNGERVGDPVQLPAGGGGTGSGIMMRLRIIGQQSLTVGEDADVNIKYDFTSIEMDTGDATGPGTYTVSVNGINVANGVANQGENTFNLKGLIFLGSNTVRVRVTDSEGNTKSVTWNIQVATLKLTSTFADDTIYNTNPVPFRYTPVGMGTKTIRFFLDGKELAPDVTDSSGRQMTKQLTGLTNGNHSLRVFAESTIEGSALKSNELYYEFIFADETLREPVIALSYNREEVPQFSTINIPFIVYNPASPTANVTIRVNGQVVSQLDVPRTKQYFSYPANTEGLMVVTFTCGATTKVLNINVVPSGLDISEETGDLEYKAFAVGKSNSSVDRDKWDYNGYTADFEGFSWADDGWQKDSFGDSCLKLIGDSKVHIGINPFANNILVTGATLTFEYSTSNVTDENAVVISSMWGGIGLELTPTSVTLKSAQSVLTANFDSSEKVSISLVIQKLAENRLVYLFVDGIASGTLQYPEGDNFTQGTQQPFTVSTGERACQLNLYGIRWYKNSLNFEQVLGNYIYDIENVEEKVSVYLRNRITDEYGNIDYNKALQFIPCMTIVGDLPNYKGDKKTSDIIYEDLQNPALSFTAYGVKNDVQGTSSQYYVRKNYKFTTRNGITYMENGHHTEKYSLRGKGIPSDTFCLKADFAESSGTHNTGMAILVDLILRQMGILVPPQLEDERVRTTIDGYPILVFHKATATAPAQFVGKYNFNYDKGSEDVFGFQPGDECWEFCNNTSPICLFKSADFSGDWLDNDLEARYPSGNTDGTQLAKLFAWVVSCIGNPAKFKAECANYFDMKNLLSYELITEFYAMIDQKAKNMMLTYYKKDGKWRLICYDNDTFGAINNEGRIAFKPNVEVYDIVDSGHVFNGWDSELWRLVRQAYAGEIQAMYQQMRQQQILTLSATLRVLQNQQADKWCELVYNHDGKFKYIDPLVEGYYDYSEDPENPKFIRTGAFLYAMQGSRSRHRIWWMTNRFAYMDSKYNAGGHINDYATMRLYTPETWGGVAPNPNFKVSAVKDGYFRVKYGSYITDGVRGKAGQTYDVTPPVPGIQFNDTETIVYGISTIKSLGDLSGKYAGTVDVTKAIALEELILGSTATGYRNENLSDLHTGNNERLKKINVANSPNLKQSLDLSMCYSLEEIEARGSGLTGFTLPKSGVLRKAYLPASFAALILRNQPYMDTLSIESHANLNTVIIDNVPGIDGYTFVKNCINTANSKLSKVRLINIDASDTSSAALNAIAQMTGEDDNGLPTDRAIVTGKIHISQMTQGAYDRLSWIFPNLVISYTTLLQVIDFEDNIVKEIMVANFDSNGDGEISPSEVETKSIPSGLLTDSGARLFNEMHYWKGNSSLLDNVETIESASLLTGKAKFQNLPALKTVHIHQGDNDLMDASPSLWSQQALTNCYNIEKWILSGRYKENSQKGVVLGRVNSENGTYYRMCYPMKGYTNVVVDEPCHWDDNYESTYGHGRLIKTVTLNAATDVIFGNSAVLETVNIHGIGWNAPCRIYVRSNKKALTYINADGSKNPGAIGDITIANNNNQPLFIKVGEGLSSIPSTSYIDVLCTENTTAGKNYSEATEIDLGTTMNSTIRVQVWREWTGTVFCGYIRRLIIRNPNAVLPLVFSYRNGVYNPSYNPFPNGIYVPDDLVDAYKAATNWKLYAGSFRNLSLLG